MAVEFKNERFGSGEAASTVADPLMLSTALPRFLSPSDTVTMPLHFFFSIIRPPPRSTLFPYTTLFRSVVGPITALFGTVTVLFAVLFLGERLTIAETVAVIIAASGSILAAIEFKGSGRIQLIGLGPLSALGAVVLGSAITVMMQHPIRADGWVPTVIAVQIGVAITACVALFAVAKFWPGMGGLDTPTNGARLP